MVDKRLMLGGRTNVGHSGEGKTCLPQMVLPSSNYCAMMPWTLIGKPVALETGDKEPSSSIRYP